MKIFFVIFLTSLCVGFQAKSDEIFEDWVSARAMGMGGAYSAVVDNHDALFFNPAALDKIHGLHLNVLAPTLGTDALTAYQTVMSAAGSSYSTLISQFFGQEVWMSISDQLSLSMHDFALGAYDYFNLSFDLHNPAYPNMNTRITNDEGIIGGFAMSLLPNDALRAGFAIKRITRYGGQIPFGPSTIATLSNSQITNLINNYGTGYGLDAGLLLELPGPSHPTFSMVWHDIGQTAFTIVGGTSALPPMDDDAVIGFSMLFAGAGFTLRPALDFTHINLDTTEQLGKLLHLGVELGFPGGLAVRTGLNQGYLTAGVGVDVGFMSVDAAYYGEELDTYPGQLEDIRYMLSFSFDLDFDPNFDFLSSKSGSGGAVSKSYERR